jgi:hypothetical protein
MMSSNEFINAIEKANLKGRILRFNKTSLGMSDTIFINFYNVPGGEGKAGGGAEAENNRVMIAVSGFDKKDLDKQVARITVDLRISFFPKARGFRGRTTRPEVGAEFIISFLEGVANEFEPKLFPKPVPA